MLTAATRGESPPIFMIQNPHVIVAKRLYEWAENLKPGFQVLSSSSAIGQSNGYRAAS